MISHSNHLCLISFGVGIVATLSAGSASATVEGTEWTVTAIAATFEGDQARYEGAVQVFSDAMHLRAESMTLSDAGDFVAERVVVDLHGMILSGEHCVGDPARIECDGGVTVLNRQWRAFADTFVVEIETGVITLQGAVWSVRSLQATEMRRTGS